MVINGYRKSRDWAKEVWLGRVQSHGDDYGLEVHLMYRHVEENEEEQLQLHAWLRMGRDISRPSSVRFGGEYIVSRIAASYSVSLGRLASEGRKVIMTWPTPGKFLTVYKGQGGLLVYAEGAATHGFAGASGGVACTAVSGADDPRWSEILYPHDLLLEGVRTRLAGVPEFLETGTYHPPLGVKKEDESEGRDKVTPESMPRGVDLEQITPGHVEWLHQELSWYAWVQGKAWETLRTTLTEEFGAICADKSFGYPKMAATGGKLFLSFGEITIDYRGGAWTLGKYSMYIEAQASTTPGGPVWSTSGRTLRLQMEPVRREQVAESEERHFTLRLILDNPGAGVTPPDGYIHPHADPVGRICWGEATLRGGLSIRRLIGGGQLWAIAHTVRGILTTYNPHNPYKTLEGFFPVVHICPKTHGCQSCAQPVCVNCTALVAPGAPGSRDLVWCSRCTESCSGCGRVGRLNTHLRCVYCEGLFCGDCMSLMGPEDGHGGDTPHYRCGECGGTWHCVYCNRSHCSGCTSSVGACARCSAQTCSPEALVTCAHCRSQYCLRCRGEGVRAGECSDCTTWHCGCYVLCATAPARQRPGVGTSDGMMTSSLPSIPTELRGPAHWLLQLGRYIAPSGRLETRYDTGDEPDETEWDGEDDEDEGYVEDDVDDDEEDDVNADENETPQGTTEPVVEP